MTTYPKKLIEVSIPLKEINDACAREKSIRHGHPSTLHLWWARRPLAAARAVLFCQLVDDPSGYVDELVKDKARKQIAEQELLREPEGDKDLSPRLRERLIEKERERLHELVKELVIWENTTNEKVLNRARQEIRTSWLRHLRRKGLPEDTPMPPVLDPFAGGGAIPLEAQRLGMEAHASDLNPVAVLINRAMIEIPPKFAGLPPVNPDWQGKTKEEKAANVWKGAQGLAEDVRYYGQWMREEAEKRIGHLYPKYELTQGLLDARPDLVKAGYQAGDKLTVIAWLWARTVPSPNPALQGKPVPLISSFWLSKKAGKEVYVEPVVENGGYRFEIRVGKPVDAKVVDAGTKAGVGSNFYCALSGVPISGDYIKESGKLGKMGASIFAVVCEGQRGRVYLPTDKIHEKQASEAEPTWAPSGKIPRLTGGSCVPYGMDDFGKLFTPRQLVALTTFSDLVGEARKRILKDAQPAGHRSVDELSLEQGGTGPQAYADAVAVYLALGVSRMADRGSTICGWDTGYTKIRNTFGRQAIPMSWDFAEANPMSDSTGNFSGMMMWVIKVLEQLPADAAASVNQLNASKREIQQGTIISSDPPYYDNIGYADLSDFFYVWLRRALRQVLPNGMGSILVPKEEELIASPYRQGSKAKAETFFLDGMTDVAHRWAEFSNRDFPATIYYAFKQAEIKKEGISSTGWATFLGALMKAGFSVVGTWPMRTEMVNKIGQSANMLASSIVLVCRQRPDTAETITRREFIEALEAELPDALKELQHANLSPVDLPQSAIGPGMAIFSRYKEIIKNDGNPMTVTEALQLINHELSHLLDGQVSDMDEHTRFASKWFAQHAFRAGSYGDAELIATATNVSVDEVQKSGILESAKGKVRILKPAELPGSWNPQNDATRTIWEIVHHLIRLAETASDTDCARVIAAIPHSEAAEARQLCYRLFILCDQNGWSQEAQAYNQLISNWQYYTDEAAKLDKEDAKPVQGDLEL
jgi:putative DNA methylase